MACAHCGTGPAMTTSGLCLPCDVEIDRQVDAMEQLLERRRAVTHYESAAASAAAEKSARLGRTDDTGQRSQKAAPVVVNASGRTEP